MQDSSVEIFEYENFSRQQQKLNRHVQELIHVVN